MKNNITVEDVANAIKSKDIKKINEASLGRVFQHYTRQNSDSFAIISAYKGGNSTSENIVRSSKLKNDVRSLGLGFFKMKGFWEECSNPNYEWQNCPRKYIVSVVEESLFIPDIKLADAIRLASKYDQEAFIFSSTSTDKANFPKTFQQANLKPGNVYLIDSNTGKITSDIGKFSPQKVAQGYSQIRNSTFVFEGFQYNPSGMMEGLQLNQYLK